MYEKTINEKVYQMSASVSENAKTLLLGMEQSNNSSHPQHKCGDGIGKANGRLKE